MKPSRRHAGLAALPALAALVLVPLGATPAAAATACDGTVDVAVGAPAASVSGQAGAGEVTVVFESSTGPLGDPADRVISEVALYQAMGASVPATAGHHFGTSVSVARDPSAPGCSVLAVGSPGAASGAGAVWTFRIDKDGLYPSTLKRITQNSAGVANSAEPGDGFGSSVLLGGGGAARWLAVGVPGEDVGSTADAGMVQVLPYPGLGKGTKTYYQGNGPVPGSAERGDRFGAALGFGRDAWSLWVGAPGEDVGSLTNAGAVVTLPGSGTAAGTLHLPGTIGGAKTVTQDSRGVPGTAEKGDRFGAVLAALRGPGSNDREPVIAAPGEDVGAARDAGSVVVAYADHTWASFQQGSGGVGGAAESGDAFGTALATWGPLLLVGVPGEDVGTVADAGLVQVFMAAGSVPKLSGAREQAVHQNTAGVVDQSEAGDRFGAAVALAAAGAVIGVPGEETGPETDIGAVELLPYVSGAPELGVSGTGSVLLLATDLSAEAGLQAGARFGSTAAAVSG